MTLKELFKLVLQNFEADAAERAAGAEYYYWTDGICIAMSCAVRDIPGSYDGNTELYKQARELLNNHRPASALAYWWRIRKDEITQEQALTPRLEVLNKIIDSL